MCVRVMVGVSDMIRAMVRARVGVRVRAMVRARVGVGVRVRVSILCFR